MLTADALADVGLLVGADCSGAGAAIETVYLILYDQRTYRADRAVRLLDVINQSLLGLATDDADADLWDANTERAAIADALRTAAALFDAAIVPPAVAP